MANPRTGVRIIAGEFRGRRIPVPPGEAIRPTQDRVREAVFSAIAPALPGTRFLDAFAGTGANGFEAISRGAAHAVMVDNHPAQRSAITKTAQEWGLSRKVDVLSAQFPNCAPALAAAGPFDMVFADPPYAYQDWAALAETFAQPGILAEDARIIIEHSKRAQLPDAIGPLTLQSTRAYGDTTITRYAKE